ncbi:MAG: L-alanine-DL-glutamate epimerase [Ruminococcaceae bacterium]|nr:L-alanine-DL-glutamate epimerase [Oscillospiraceae bacterium]
MKIVNTNLSFTLEPFIKPFGFKGGYINELWNVVARVTDDSGEYGVGCGVQSVLWSDSAVFAESSVCGGNIKMIAISEYALSLLKGREFGTPIEAMDAIFADVYEYAKRVTNNGKLKKTFALNALVPVDNALWQLYGRMRGTEDFLSLVPSKYRSALGKRTDKLCNIPLVTYKMSIDEVLKLVNDGFFFLKIKIGSDPDGDGSREKMLEWDKNRLKEIHEAVKDIKIEYTENGHIPYYFDANGRYDSKDRLKEFLDYAEQIGALDRIMILEEPFPEEYKVDVSDLGVRIAADESAHSVGDALERIALGYGAIALKPIAKTMSESIKILFAASEKNIPCFCADLTVNPLMVDFNKNVAARIELFPGMKIGIVESNGAQNYVNWEKMMTYHPLYGKAGFIEAKNGIFNLDDDFYKTSGGIFLKSDYYESLV